MGAPTCPSPPAMQERFWKLLKTLAEVAASQLLPFLPEKNLGLRSPGGRGWHSGGWGGGASRRCAWGLRLCLFSGRPHGRPASAQALLLI